MSPSPADDLPESERFILSRSPSETETLGQVIASGLEPGDLIAVSGELGAGKSVLCRAIIRSLMQDSDLEVPSPSYTLVNVYDHADFQIWHADLFRIGDESELEEIGLEDAARGAIVLLEWPERWENIPDRRLLLSIMISGDHERRLRTEFIGEGWQKLTRQLETFA